MSADPFKEMTRELDARVVERGGASIFTLKPGYVYTVPAPLVERPPYCAPEHAGRRRWFGEELEALRIAYEGNTVKLESIARDFRTSHGNVCRMARENGWKMRRGEEPTDYAAHGDTPVSLERTS